jgi:hypothetical protein
MSYGNPTPDAERLRFRIQDYPKNTSSYPHSRESASIFALTADLMWSAPAWQPQGDTLTLDTLHAPRTVSNYGYYFAVLETQTNPQGQTYASRVRVDVLIDSISHSEQMIPYQKSMGIQSLLFSSTDGLTFHLDSLTPNLGSLKYNWNNPTQNGFCAAGGLGQGDYFSPTQATLTLNPASEQADLSVNFNGAIIYDYYNENIPDHPYACRLISNQTGSGAVNLNMTFHVDFEKETPTPTPTPTVPPQCDMGNAPKAVPDDLKPLLDGLKNIPEGKPVPAKQAQNILQQLKTLQQQLNQSGVATQNFQIQGEKARSNQDKQQAKIIKEIAKLESKLENLQMQTLSDFQVFDQNYQSVVSLIQQYYDYELLRYDGNLHPNSLARYKTTLDRIAYARDYFSWSGNTYDLLYAGFIQTLEFQVYRMLVQDILEQELPLTGAQDEPNYEFYSSALNEIQTGEDLLKYLGKQLSKHTQNLELTQAHAQTNYDVFLGILPYETSRSAQPEAEDGDDSALPFSTQSSIRSPHLMPREMNLPLGDFRILRNPALVEYEGGGPGIPAGFTFGGGSVSWRWWGRIFECPGRCSNDIFTRIWQTTQRFLRHRFWPQM